MNVVFNSMTTKQKLYIVTYTQSEQRITNCRYFSTFTFKTQEFVFPNFRDTPRALRSSLNIAFKSLPCFFCSSKKNTTFLQRNKCKTTQCSSHRQILYFICESPRKVQKIILTKQSRIEAKRLTINLDIFPRKKKKNPVTRWSRSQGPISQPSLIPPNNHRILT